MRRLLTLGVFCVAMAVAGPKGTAALSTWVGSPGVPSPWEDPNNWEDGSLPTQESVARLSNGGTAVICGPSSGFGNLQLSAGGVFQGSGNVLGGAAWVGRWGNGSYWLDGGKLITRETYVGFSGSRGHFRQTGGSFTPTYLEIADTGHYEWQEGTLMPIGGLKLHGRLNMCNTPRKWELDEVVLDFSTGHPIRAEQTELILGASSLLLTRLFDHPENWFTRYTNDGLTHAVGTDLLIPSGRHIRGAGKIEDTVICEGTLSTPPQGYFFLNGGLQMRQGADANLGFGHVTSTPRSPITIAGGTLRAEAIRVLDGGAYQQKNGVVEIVIQDPGRSAQGVSVNGSSDWATATMEVTGGSLQTTSLCIGTELPGSLSIQGCGTRVTATSYQQGLMGELHIAVDANGPPVLTIDGTASLNGLLDVDERPGYTPEPGQRLKLMAFKQHVGNFMSVDGTRDVGGNPGLWWELIYDSNELSIVATALPGDITLNGSVDVGDLGVLAANWGRNGSWGSGDLSGDGVIDVADLGILAGNWGAGVDAPVPEPSSACMLLLLSLLATARKDSRVRSVEDGE